MAGILERSVQNLGDQSFQKATEDYFDKLRNLLRRQRRSYRRRLITLATKGLIDPEQTGDRLDSIRWLHRSAYHVWRIVHHLRKSEDVLLAGRESV